MAPPCTDTHHNVILSERNEAKNLEQPKRCTHTNMSDTQDATALSSYGFALAGKWILTKRVKSGVEFKLTQFQEDRVVYAFSVSDEPVP